MLSEAPPQGALVNSGASDLDLQSEVEAQSVCSLQTHSDWEFGGNTSYLAGSAQNMQQPSVGCDQQPSAERLHAVEQQLQHHMSITTAKFDQIAAQLTNLAKSQFSLHGRRPRPGRRERQQHRDSASPQVSVTFAASATNCAPAVEYMEPVAAQTLTARGCAADTDVLPDIERAPTEVADTAPGATHTAQVANTAPAIEHATPATTAIVDTVASAAIIAIENAVPAVQHMGLAASGSERCTSQHRPSPPASAAARTSAARNCQDDARNAVHHRSSVPDSTPLPPPSVENVPANLATIGEDRELDIFSDAGRDFSDSPGNGATFSEVSSQASTATRSQVNDSRFQRFFSSGAFNNATSFNPRPSDPEVETSDDDGNDEDLLKTIDACDGQVCTCDLLEAFGMVDAAGTSDRCHNCMLHDKILAMLAEPNFPGVNARGEEGETALHKAACKGMTQVAQRILEHPGFIEVNAICECGETALHKAAWTGQAKLAQQILDQPDFTGANARTTKTKRTALHYAAINGMADCARTLLKHEKFTAEDKCDATKRWNATKYAEHPKVIEVLRRYGPPAHPSGSLDSLFLFE